MGAVIRRAWLALGVAGGVFGCAEWAGPGPGGPRLSIVPVFGIVGLGGGIVLLDDLDVLRVVVRSSSPTRAPVVVADTTVPVDEAGNATITVPVIVVGSAETYLIDVQGIRSRDGAVLYTGSDAVTVLAGYARPVDSVPVAYVGPCGPGAGCRVTVAPQDTTLAPAGSLVMRISVDSALTSVTGVPVALTNLTPGLVLVGPDRTVTALLSPTGGPGLVEAAIRGAADTLRLTVAPLTAPAAVLVNQGYVTLTTLSPANTAQLTAVVTDIAGKQLSPSLATWTSRPPGVATVSSTGLVTGVSSGSAIVVATAAPGVADSLVVMVGNATILPGNPLALALTGGRSFGVAKLGQPVAIDVVIDLKAVTAELLGSYDARFTWNAGVLRYDSTQAGSFVPPAVIADTAAGGILRFSATDLVGAIGSQTLARLWFTATGLGPSSQVLSLPVLSAALTSLDLTPGLLVAPGGATIVP